MLYALQELITCRWQNHLKKRIVLPQAYFFFTYDKLNKRLLNYEI